MRIAAACLLTACAVSPDGLDETTTPTPRGATIFDRLHDDAGPVPGLDGFSFVQTADDTRCGGIAVTLVRADDAVVSPNERAFVTMLEVRYPGGLDFSQPDREATMKRFDGWLRDVKQHSQAALEGYEQQLAAAHDDGTAVSALARTAQVPRHFASLLVRAEIPVDVRSGEHVDDKRAAFCDALATAAVPLLDKADEAASTCAERAATVAPGWWSSVCVR